MKDESLQSAALSTSDRLPASRNLRQRISLPEPAIAVR